MLAGTSVARSHHVRVDHRSEVTEVIIPQIARDITLLHNYNTCVYSRFFNFNILHSFNNKPRVSRRDPANLAVLVKGTLRYNSQLHAPSDGVQRYCAAGVRNRRGTSQLGRPAKAGKPRGWWLRKQLVVQISFSRGF